jgi:rubrerythrin
MSITFNADEIFEMAEEIERDGAKFYRLAAANSTDSAIKEMLLGMAAMEEGHLKTFRHMRKELRGQEKAEAVYDPDNQAVLYLQTMAGAHGYEGKISPTKQLVGNETTKEILETALSSEKESVVFYFGLKSFVPAKAGKDKVEAIILEELGHITTLLKKLESLK